MYWIGCGSSADSINIYWKDSGLELQLGKVSRSLVRCNQDPLLFVEFVGEEPPLLFAVGVFKEARA